MIAIIDYGVGNLYSLKCSLDALSIENCVTKDEQVIKSADGIILPGVGAFEDAIKSLRKTGLDITVTELAKSGKPLLGICLGMQMLFEKSFEYGEHDGLGLIPGKVVAMEGRIPSKYKIPHIGWNSLHFTKENCPIFKYLKEKDFVYFVHSFFADECDENVVATAEYGIDVTAAVQKDNIFGCQFHPEKSGDVGLAILKAFAEEVKI